MAIQAKTISFSNDMRTLKLEERFDVVAIPDYIGYMVIVKDLKKAILSAYKHLKL